ncbi:MAG: hypothetical protein NWF14_01105, partial [Candidatus Bathyarchaeota archaeon]|nr:hypothetical protein [Candidatus Bathyarchaeota archaeon]
MVNARARPALTTTRAVVILALIVVVAGGGYWWYSSSLQPEPQPTPSPTVELPTTYLRYSRFGFSFDYPEEMTFTAGALL